ncbi:hypothetical protein ACFC08_39370, partial [Streptomyces sp. NPDC056112]|uniref:hypothetical protein n=1 Tax=Streptomyces sp. NPDC056112 TaxID=3345715 RepID=UPI0035E11FA7
LYAHDRTGISVRMITRTAGFERDPVCHNALRQTASQVGASPAGQLTQRVIPGSFGNLIAAE